MLNLQMLVQTSLRAVKRDETMRSAEVREEREAYIPIAFGAVIDWTNIVSLDLISCAPVSLPALVCDVKGHA